MAKVELEIERDENTKDDIAEKLELVFKSNMVTKEEILHKFVAKDVIKNKMIAITG